MALFLCVISCTAEKGLQLRYHEDGTFRIAQLTDIHWCDDSTALCAKTLESMESVYSIGNPDLVVITGDVVVDAPIIKGWHTIISWLDAHKVPYLIAMGNHDAEYFVVSSDELAQARTELGSDPSMADDDVAKNYIYQLLMKSEYYVGGLGHEASGWGNVAVPIYGSKEASAVKNVVYMLDSHDYPADRFDGYYDWIHTDQVAWYTRKSKEFTKANGGKPIPSLSFFHIPLHEHARILKDDTTYGHMLDGVDPGDINSGFFANCYENGDMMGIFVGHDHDNDFVGIHHGIVLGFGRASGWNGYGHQDRGGRIIELTEDSRCFSTACISPKGREATVWLPDGMNSDEAENSVYLPALTFGPDALAEPSEPLKHGVSYQYYEGEWQSVNEMLPEQLVSEGTMENIDITSAASSDHFGYVFNALIKSDIKAVYRFKMFSDDGAQLYLDDQLVVDNDGSHSTRLAAGKVALDEGYHRLTVRYFDDYMGEHLGITISARHIAERAIETDDLYIEK